LNVVCSNELTVPESRRRSKTEGLPYPSLIYSCIVAYHRDALSVLAKVIPEFIDRCNDPKVEKNFYCLDLTQGSFPQSPQSGIAIAKSTTEVMPDLSGL